jgi:RES domain-containing protein
MPSPWRPPGLDPFSSFLQLALDIEGGTGGVLEEAHVVWVPCHRIISSEYAGENLFDRLTADIDYLKQDDEAEALREIADLTNTYVQSAGGNLDLVRPEDRIYGYGTGLIMAAFAFPGRVSRFSDGSAGTYYAARDLETAIAETRYHEELALQGSGPCVTEKTAIHAELDGTLVDLRRGHASPRGVYDSADYAAGQAFGAVVRHLDGYGIVFDSVRQADRECVAVFRPPVLRRAQAVQTLQYHWDGKRIFDVR